MTDDTTTDVQPIEAVPHGEQQHMLFLFLPLKQAKSLPPGEEAGTPPTPSAVSVLQSMFSGNSSDGTLATADPRSATGVHFFMIYELASTALPICPPTPPFPTFQLPPPNPVTGIPRNLAVVIAIYDRDFGPYIRPFVNDPNFAKVLDVGLLGALDETGLVDPKDPSSAQNILNAGGTNKNFNSFIQLLMRYNWGDPTIPGATSPFPTGMKNPPQSTKYFLGATFPGMTVEKILNTTNGFKNANELWPYPPPTTPIDFG